MAADLISKEFYSSKAGRHITTYYTDQGMWKVKPAFSRKVENDKTFVSQNPGMVEVDETRSFCRVGLQTEAFVQSLRGNLTPRVSTPLLPLYLLTEDWVQGHKHCCRKVEQT